MEKVKKETYFEKESGVHSTVTRKTLNMFLKRNLLLENCRVLDVGCGQGVALELFKEKRFSAVGITLNSEDALACRQKGYEVYEMDHSFPEFREEEFDFFLVQALSGTQYFSLFYVN